MGSQRVTRLARELFSRVKILITSLTAGQDNPCPSVSDRSFEATRLHGLAHSDQQRLCLDPIYPIPFCRGGSTSCYTLWAQSFLGVDSVTTTTLFSCVQSHGLQHTGLPWPSLALGVCSKFMSVSFASMMPSNHLILCRPLLPSIFPSISVFSTELALHVRWP